MILRFADWLIFREVTKVLSQAHESTYQAYLLRHWEEDGAQRFMLEEVFGAQRRQGFATAQALLTYLEAVLELRSNEAEIEGLPNSWYSSVDKNSS